MRFGLFGKGEARGHDGAKAEAKSAAERLKAGVRELLGLAELPAEDEHDFNTVAGMVVAHFGRTPQVGERFDWRGWRFEVVDLDGARVDKILAARVPVAADAEESG